MGCTCSRHTNLIEKFIMQQIRFTIETLYGPYSDALYLNDDHGLTEDQIDALKQERVDNWIAIAFPSDES